MGKGLLFLDVETPNGHNDRISSIGLIRCDSSGDVLKSGSYYVNPEEPFSDINIGITGIHPCDVADAPNFRQLWIDELSGWFDHVDFVAHNATFDLCVLRKVFQAYGIKEPVWSYSCTKKLAQKLHPEFDSYKLPRVCHSLGFEMGEHHRALNDAEACRKIWMALSPEVPERAKLFSVYNDVPQPSLTSAGAYRRNLSESTTIYNQFLKLCEQIIANGMVSMNEAISAIAYIAVHPTMVDDPTIQEVNDILVGAVSDGDIDSWESDQLVELLNGLIDPVASGCSEVVIVPGHSFCLSGDFYYGSKDEVKQLIESAGGACLPGVSKKCDYVLVGGRGNERWTNDHYGSKVKKALDLQAKGVPIRIVGEASLSIF